MSFTWKHACILATAVLQAPHLAHAAEYKLAREYSGDTFFEGWKFFDAVDTLNNGDVEFIGADEAGNPATSLAYVDPTTKRAILKVDNTTVVPWNEKRKSVRITSEEAYDFGSVFVADIHHFPYGCSVWSSFWSWNEGAGESWPDGGEIDIFEAINQAPRSQMGLHTLAGCTQPEGVQQLSSEVRTRDCAGDNNSGCIVANTDAASYGPPLNSVGGGIYVTEYAETGISIWFFARDKIPPSITPTSQTIDTSTLGVPMGSWPSSSCDISRLFKPQNIVMKITLCGDFAGRDLFNQTGCQGRCYEDFVIGEPGRYSEAFFDVASVRIFNADGVAPSSSGSSGTPTGRPGNSTDPEEAGAAMAMRLPPFLASAAAFAAVFALAAI